MGNITMVSIICNAYNHEKFIKNALDGFVMQETSFPYEVLIHDDASLMERQKLLGNMKGNTLQ